MRFLSVCSGIEAASVAWAPLGWKAVAFSEIEPFPCAVLAHHYPTTPNWGDMTKYEEWPDVSIDLLCGGTPCQSFSVAGLRKGLADPRGNLMLTFGAIASKYRPQWLVWENVPGVLSSNGGRDFGAFLGMLGQLGYGFAYRVLDAQYFGVAQRRRRVFVVGCLGDWRSAASVLFERHSLCGHPAPSREAREDTARGSTVSTGSRSVAGALTTCYGKQPDSSDTALGPNLVIEQRVRRPALSASTGDEGFDASEDDTGRGQPIVAFDATGSSVDAGDVFPTLRKREGGAAGHGASVSHGMAVRRLTPRECERLQGFPDGYTAIPWRGKLAGQCPDGPRYKALGNSWAVPNVAWIGRRIDAVHAVAQEKAA